MSVFPSTKKRSFKFKSKKDINKSNYGGGYVQTRPKYTRAVKTFTFHFSSLTQVQSDEINDFLVETRGLSFTFIHPFKETTHEVRLLDDLPEFMFDEGLYNSSEITLEEV